MVIFLSFVFLLGFFLWVFVEFFFFLLLCLIVEGGDFVFFGYCGFMEFSIELIFYSYWRN